MMMRVLYYANVLVFCKRARRFFKIRVSRCVRRRSRAVFSTHYKWQNEAGTIAA